MVISPLQRFREARGWSQADMARFLEVSRATLHRWEQDKRRIGRRHLPTVSEKTKIPARELRPDLAKILEGV